MKSRALLLAVELAAARGAGAWLVSWPRDELNWFPPRQTHAVEARDDTGTSPVPTSAPQVDLFKRSDDVCGYVSGIAESTFGCLNGAYCVSAVNTHFGYSLVDCCRSADVSSCTVVTTCLDSTQSDLYPGSTSERTQYCSESSIPYCVTYSYGAGSFSGFSWFACGASKVIRTVFRSPTAGGTTPTSGPPPTNHVTPPTPSPTTPTPTPTPAPSSDNNSPPVGAIVGGVVGGVAVIAIIGFSVFFLVCYKKRPAQPAPGPAPVSYMGPEKPPVNPMYAGAAVGMPAHDPRASTFKPPYGVTEAYAPAGGYGGPPPQGPGSPVPTCSPNGGYTPPPQQAQYAPQPGGMGVVSTQTTGASMYSVPQQQQPQPHMYGGQPQIGYSAELPTARGDRELQELA